MKKKKSLRLLKAKAWKLFSEFIRRSYANASGLVACYTCGDLMIWKESQCGHAIGGRHNAVLLDAEICRPQCVRCNVFMRGRYEIFATKLIKENGMEWWDGKLDGARLLVKFTASDMEGLILSYKQKLEELPA